MRAFFLSPAPSLDDTSIDKSHYIKPCLAFSLPVRPLPIPPVVISPSQTLAPARESIHYLQLSSFSRPSTPNTLACSLLSAGPVTHALCCVPTDRHFAAKRSSAQRPEAPSLVALRPHDARNARNNLRNRPTYGRTEASHPGKQCPISRLACHGATSQAGALVPGFPKADVSRNNGAPRSGVIPIIPRACARSDAVAPDGTATARGTGFGTPRSGILETRRNGREHVDRQQA